MLKRLSNDIINHWEWGMDRVFDIHNHILPGVDDGSKDMDMSIRMLKIAAKDGITDIILTPHNKPDRRNVYASEMLPMIEALKKRCKEEGIEIRLHRGNEIYYRKDVVERLEIGKATTMAGSRYVLLEFSPKDTWDYVKKGTYEILAGGYMPIIAHVERYEHVVSHISRVSELCDMGAYIQINASSLMGEVGRPIKKISKELMKEGLVSFIASDAHEDKKRTPKLKAAIKYVNKKFGELTATRIFKINPMKVIEDEYI